MKKLILSALTALALTASVTASAAGLDMCAGNEVKLQIGNPMMNACGVLKEVDPGRGTAPVISGGSTLVPIRAVIEAFGGFVEWDGQTRTVYVSGRDTCVSMTVDKTTATVYDMDGDREVTLSAAPVIMDGRTMVPLRFVSESLGFNVIWDEGERIATISEPKGMSVRFENLDGAFYPIGDLLDVRMGAKDSVKYFCKGKTYDVSLDIVSVEQLDESKSVVDGNGDEIFYSSITVDEKKYDISNIYNFEFAGIADLSPDADGFEIIVVDNGVSEDYSVTVFTYNRHGLVCTKTYGGMTYEYYANGTGTVYCDGNGRIVNSYIGFTEPMYALAVNKITGGEGIVAEEGEYVQLDPAIAGKELVFGMDLSADYREVDEYPESEEDIWETEPQLMTVKKGTPVIIDKIRYYTDEESGERYIRGCCARIDGKKYVIELRFAG